VSLAMTLDLARIELERGDAGAAAELVDAPTPRRRAPWASCGASCGASTRRRSPSTGSRHALGELADAAPLPVDGHVDLDRRLPESVESCAYFVIAEAVVNAARHSGADRVRRPRARPAGASSSSTVRDDGTGGADPARGTGSPGWPTGWAPWAGASRSRARRRPTDLRRLPPVPAP
jgi:hypothetical protein